VKDGEKGKRALSKRRSEDVGKVLGVPIVGAEQDLAILDNVIGFSIRLYLERYFVDLPFRLKVEMVLRSAECTEFPHEQITPCFVQRDFE
jgi:hypothetical protein